MNTSATLLCMAMAIYQEARGEPLAGQVADAHVILNRVASDRYPDDICAVVTQERQFSFSWTAPRNTSAWEQAVMVAESVIRGDTIDPTSGALYYHQRDIQVAWTREMHGRVIGNHVFWIVDTR